MPHDVSLISTLAAGFALALALGFVASRLKVPPLVGYLLAGVAIGPATPVSWPTCSWPGSWPRSA